MSKHDDEFEGVPTTGHEWDGIREYDKPMPRWWLLTFYATIIWAIGFTILYPAWPRVLTATPGVLKFSSRQVLQQELDNAEAANAVINSELAAADLTKIGETPELQQYAISKGAAVFRTWCAQCHGSGAQGAKGFPSLLDDDWLWGGTIQDIDYTVTHGIRNETDPDARFSQMPAFGEILSGEEIDDVVNYVMSLSNEPHDADKAKAGATIFADNCASCHGEDGKGSHDVGAPNLTDAVWLYGGDHATLVQTVTNARFGVMPAWGQRLSKADVAAAATYVHQLGGGQ